MNNEMESIRCSIMRGGTSKGIFLMENDLPAEQKKRDEVIRAIFGSPDIRQIDGLGGADVLSSKLAIIGPPSRADADVDYTFGQVSFETDFIDYNGNCGNISSAVGPFVIDAGLVRSKEPFTKVRIHMTNSGKILTADVPVKDGKALVEGECAIDGVPGTGAKITMDWSDTGGTITGKLLPTGKVRDYVTVEGKEYQISIVDAGNPLIFIKAEELGLYGTEAVAEIENNPKLMRLIEEIRGKGAVLCGLVNLAEEAKSGSPYNPFFSIVSSPRAYKTYNNTLVSEDETDLVCRLLFMLKMHKTYPITGTVCTGVAVNLEGTIPWEVARRGRKEGKPVRIGHPGGIISVQADAELKDGAAVVNRASVYRTARKIMDGYVYVRKSILK